ncbi:MAG: phytanoyl-CoA dioxygenase family protein [Pseudomonadota bacterium]
MHRCPVIQALLLPKPRWIAIPLCNYNLFLMTRSKPDLFGDGRIWMRNALSEEERTCLLDLMAGPDRPGARIPLTEGIHRVLGQCAFLSSIAEVWPGMRPVRMVGFEKRADKNWVVPWHQDRIIAVAEKTELDGFHNWSRKGDAWHCEPPEHMLREMLFVRIHLDPNTAENGAMEIAQGSHAQGLVPADQAERVAQSYPTEVTEADSGDVLILPMLCLHRSGVSKTSEARRVLRLDFSPLDLPPPLRWAS